MRNANRKPPKRTRPITRPALALAIVAFLVAGMALPIVISRHGGHFELQPASVLAGSPDVFVITEPVQLGTQAGIAIASGVVSLDLPAGKNMVGREAQAWLASGNARLRLERASIIAGAAAKPTPPASPRKSDGTGDGASSPLVEALRRLAFESLTLVDSSIRLDLGPQRSEVLENVALKIVKRRTVLSAKGAAVLRGQTASLEATLTTVGSSAGRTPLKLSLKSPLLGVQLEGTVSVAKGLMLQGDGKVTMTDARGAARWLGFEWPVGPGMKNVQAIGTIDFSGTTIAIQRARLVMDGNEANGTLSFRTTGGRPIINATLALAALDLTPYMAGWHGMSNPLQAALATGPGPFALPLTQVLDADLRISADRIKAYSVDLGRGAATVSIKEGRLLADVAELEIFGSHVNGLLTFDGSRKPPRYEINAKLTGADLGALSQAFGAGSAVQGKGDVSIDVTASGEWSSDIARTANGRASLRMPEGGRLGFDLRGLKELAVAKPLSGWATARRSSTAIATLSARLALTDGLVLAETMSFITSDWTISATGGGNLRTGLVDVRLSLGGQRAKQSERDALALGTLRDSLLIRGAWSEPMIRYEPAAVPGKGSVTPVGPAGGASKNRVAPDKG